MNSKSIKIPEKIRRESGTALPPLFEVTYNFIRNPRNGIELKRLILETSDWVNIVALTQDNQLLVVRQYRSGIDSVTSETPAGIIDPGEDSFDAAKRELREETGYASNDWHYLGAVKVNPPIMTNTCHQWLAKNIYKDSAPDLDEGEDIAVELFSIKTLQLEIETGSFCHSLAFSALSRVPEIWRHLNFETSPNS